MYEDRNYVIFNMSEVDKIDFNTVLETSVDTLRLSVDQTKSFVKYDGDMPECVLSLESIGGPYSHSEILEVLSGPEWTAPIDEEMI